MIPTLRSARLILRPPRPEDAEAITLYLDNFAVSGNLARVPHPYRLADARAWLATHRPDLKPHETGFIIELAGAGLVGNVGYHIDGKGVIVIGYWLGEPFWNRGIMTEAAGMALDWYFTATGAASVDSGVFAFNKPSLAVQNKLGFTEIGTSRLHCLARNAELAHIDTRLTRSAWMERDR